MKYKSDRIIDGKRRKVIVEDEKIINRNPNKEELKDLEYESYVRRSKVRMSELSDNDILGYLNQFYRENGRIPGTLDFNYDPKYPSFVAYQKRFGSDRDGWATN